MTAQLTPYHHIGETDVFTLDHFPDGDLSSGVVIVRDERGTHPEAVSQIEPVGVNVELLRRELEFVTTHQHDWDQSWWIARRGCGTTACLAGWVVQHCGYVPVGGYPSRGGPWHYYNVLVDGRPVFIQDVAQVVLGLDFEQAKRLFDHRNTLHDLWRIARDITQGAIEIPSDVEAQS